MSCEISIDIGYAPIEIETAAPAIALDFGAPALAVELAATAISLDLGAPAIELAVCVEDQIVSSDGDFLWDAGGQLAVGAVDIASIPAA